jgi:flagellar FliL protein
MTGNKTFDTILLGMASAATAAALGIFVYTEMIYERPLPSDEAEKKALIADSQSASSPENFKIDKMIINLNSQTSRLRFLDVEMYFVPYKSDYNETFKAQISYVKDAIIDITSNMQPDELNTIAGKVLLEERIRSRLNDFFGKSLIKEILFSRFVVQ